MGKFLVNGTIEATSHITIKNGADLYLQAPSSTPNDSGDLVFTTYDGTEQGRIWISGGVGLIRFSSSDASKTLIHSGNIGSQSVNYASSAGNANLLDSIDSTGFLRYYNGNNAGLTNADIVNTPSYLWTVSTTGGTINTSTRPSGMDNAWGVLHIHTHSGSYATQLGFGGTTGNLYFRNAYASDTFDSWKTLIHSGNISSQSVNYATSAGNADTVDGHHFHWSGQSGQPTWLWGGNDSTNMYVYNPSNFSVNYANSAGHSTYLNTVAGNEIRFHNATGLTAGGSLWLGWAWADGNKTVTKDWYIGNFSGGGLANIYASTFNGTLNGTASSANWASGASYSNSSNALTSTGWGNGNFTYLQTSGDFYGNSGWSHYLISNHGDGSSYYNFVIALPFWSYPKYKRMSGGSEGSWYNFHTTENVIIQNSIPGAGFYGQIWFKI